MTQREEREGAGQPERGDEKADPVVLQPGLRGPHLFPVTVHPGWGLTTAMDCLGKPSPPPPPSPLFIYCTNKLFSPAAAPVTTPWKSVMRP